MYTASCKHYEIDKCVLCNKYYNDCKFIDTINHHYFNNKCKETLKYHNKQVLKKLMNVVTLFKFLYSPTYFIFHSIFNSLSLIYMYIDYIFNVF